MSSKQVLTTIPMPAISAFELNDTKVRRVQGTVLALALRPTKGQTVDLQDGLELSPKQGVIGDHGTSKKRQVTFLDKAAWQTACEEVGVEIEWTKRRSNVLVSGLDLPKLVGSEIRVGSALVEIIGEVFPCHNMDAVQQGLKLALKPQWRGGVYGRVVGEGEVTVGDQITIHSSQ